MFFSINKEEKNQAIIQCKCGCGSGYRLYLDEDNELIIESLLPYSHRLLNRIKTAFKILIGKKIGHTDVILDYNIFQNGIEEFLENNNNYDQKTKESIGNMNLGKLIDYIDRMIHVPENKNISLDLKILKSELLKKLQNSKYKIAGLINLCPFMFSDIIEAEYKNICTGKEWHHKTDFNEACHKCWEFFLNQLKKEDK